MDEKGKAREYREFKNQVKKFVKTCMADGMSRVVATHEALEYAKERTDHDLEVMLPGLMATLYRSERQTPNSIAKLVGYPYKDVMYGFSSLLLMGQVTNKFNKKEWIVMPRAAKYMPDYSDRNSKPLFYPFTALMIEAYLRTQSPKAWNTRECTFGIRKQEWFEAHSNAYKNIINEFGAAALPPCFVA